MNVEIVAIEPFGHGVLALTDAGAVWAIDHGRATQRWPEIANVSAIGARHRYAAVVSDDTTLNLFGPFVKFGIPFYGEPITCCAVSPGFRIAVAGTCAGSLVICSLFSGTKTRVLSLGAEFRLVRTTVAPGWGFIVTHGIQTVDGLPLHWFWVHNCNGMLIRATPVNFAVATWEVATSPSGFDYILLASETRKLYLIEAFYLDIDTNIYRFPEKVVALTYCSDDAVVLAMLQTGVLHFIPLQI
jgi:hypothetical protein